jgi:hypothetical protein
MRNDAQRIINQASPFDGTAIKRLITIEAAKALRTGPDQAGQDRQRRNSQPPSPQGRSSSLRCGRSTLTRCRLLVSAATNGPSAHPAFRRIGCRQPTRNERHIGRFRRNLRFRPARSTLAKLSCRIRRCRQRIVKHDNHDQPTELRRPPGRARSITTSTNTAHLRIASNFCNGFRDKGSTNSRDLTNYRLRSSQRRLNSIDPHTRPNHHPTRVARRHPARPLANSLSAFTIIQRG